MAGALPRHLLPLTAQVGPDGRLSVGGCDLGDLAAEHGTPLFVYDEAHLRARCREAVAVFGDGVAYAFEMANEFVDGMDVMAVREATLRAIERARKDSEPTLLEVRAYRYMGHSMSDPGNYRTREEIAKYQERDPIKLFSASLLEEILTDADLDTLGRENYMERNADLRRELAFFGQEFTDQEWYIEQLKFLEAHKYFTASARSLRDPQKGSNIAELRHKLEGMKTRE